jgi:hypothetical protein
MPLFPLLLYVIPLLPLRCSLRCDLLPITLLLIVTITLIWVVGCWVRYAFVVRYDCCYDLRFAVRYIYVGYVVDCWCSSLLFIPLRVLIIVGDLLLLFRFVRSRLWDFVRC